MDAPNSWRLFSFQHGELPIRKQIVSSLPVLFKEELGLKKILIAVAAAGFLFTLFSMSTSSKNKKRFPPGMWAPFKIAPSFVPGLPIVGNLLQLMDRKPHHSFTSWSEKYGPIFTIKTGLLNQVVITSSELAKEKRMVATSDYGEEHRLLKKIVMTNLLGPSPQRGNRPIRDSELEKMIKSLHAELKSYPQSTGEVNVREYTRQAMFSFVLRQTFGRDIEEVYVAGMGSLSKKEIFDILVSDPMRGALLVDWRDFFPPLKIFISNSVLENEVKQMVTRRSKVIQALIEEQRKHSKGKAKSDYSYVDNLLANYQNLNDTPLLMSVWEPVVESSDTTLLTTEWAMYELALQPFKQERLYHEIRKLWVIGQ
ncbi:hypothetical protein O6H91_08G049500 [Diphasiastrum complanatum]|uniref:Uncharacterized protein n=1 Tax=Diphasiastrum complanatum TaxID=34168 RepID=A0ACC2CXF6_DIPCM|nr:hypothetical protein O6H91_08G049500 [Diphasiastrum complanatum]